MPSHARLSKAAVADLLDQGLSNREIAKRLGCCHRRISQLRTELDFPADYKPDEWNDRQIDFLRRNWGTMPAAKIAAEVGRTKSGVIGKAHRLGLPNLGNPAGPSKSKPEPRPAYKRHAKPVQAPVVAPKPKPIMVPSAPPAPPVRLLDASPKQCRWVVTENRDYRSTLICGAPVVRGQWCVRHAELVGQKRKE